MKRFVAIALLAAGLLSSSTSALAQRWATEKFYAGGSFGQSDIETTIASPLITSGTVDGKDNAFKIFGGLQFHPNWAVEVAYIDLGTVRYSGTFPFLGVSLPVTNGTIDVDGFSAGIVGSLPLGQAFSVHGKFGFWGYEQVARDTTGGFPFNETANDGDIYFGVGIAYQMTKTVGVRLEWEQYHMNADKANLATLGMLFRF
jgi:OmpA-OmpF porin, OOP family